MEKFSILLLAVLQTIMTMQPQVTVDAPTSINRYDAVFIEDSLYILTYGMATGTLAVSKLVDGVVQDVFEPEAIVIQPRTLVDAMQATDEGHAVLKFQGAFRILDWLHASPQSSQPAIVPFGKSGGQVRPSLEFYDPLLLDAPNISYFLYTDCCGYTKWTIAMDNVNRQYAKQFLVSIRGGKANKPQMIQPGRVNGENIAATLSGDTLLAVWQERGKPSFAWLDDFGPGPENSLVFSTFDGENWSERLLIAPSDEPMDDYGAVVGLHPLDNGLFAFWSNNITRPRQRDTYEVFYKSTRDRTTWSPRQSCPFKVDPPDNRPFWSAAVSPDGRLHVLARLADSTTGVSYLTFDGASWHNHGVVIDGDFRNEKIVVDSQSRAYALWLTGPHPASSVQLRKLETSVGD